MLFAMVNVPHVKSDYIEMCTKCGNQDGKMNLNLRLQTSVPQAKSGLQMCFVWLTECLKFDFGIICQHLRFGRFQIEIWILGFLEISPAALAQTSTALPA